MKSIGRTGNAKVCVSSRFWPVFDNGFGFYPKLKLERLTQGDIRRHVDSELIKAAGLEVNDTDYEKLKAEIVDKPQGVFFWVSLVVRNLKGGLVEGDTMGQLLAHLENIPSDLDKFFQKIIASIPAAHRRRATLYFRVILASRDRPTLLDLSFLEEDETSSLMDRPLAFEHLTTISARKKSMKRRLESRCMGLLETRETESKRGTWTNAYVDYLHRTVRDFLMGEQSQQILSEHSTANFDAHDFLCQAALAQLKMIDSGDGEVIDLARSFLKYAGQHEVEPGVAHPNHVDEFFKLINYHREKVTKVPPHHKTQGVMVAIALASRLEKYAVERIPDPSIDPHAKHSHFVLRQICDKASEIPLLGWCLSSPSNLLEPLWVRSFCYPIRDNPWGMPNDDDTALVGPMSDAIEALLAKGADPNAQFGNRTLWEQLLARVYSFSPARKGDPDVPYTYDHPVFREWAHIAKLLIKSGASETGEDPRHPSKYISSAAAGHKRRYNASPRDLADAVENIFGDSGGAEMAKMLRSRKPTFRLPWRKASNQLDSNTHIHSIASYE